MDESERMGESHGFGRCVGSVGVRQGAFETPRVVEIFFSLRVAVVCELETDGRDARRRTITRRRRAGDWWTIARTEKTSTVWRAWTCARNSGRIRSFVEPSARLAATPIKSTRVERRVRTPSRARAIARFHRRARIIVKSLRVV